MTTYVLVHGGWHGGWCWRDVESRLRAAGRTVYAPTLSGLAERSHQLHDRVDLTTHVTDLVNLVIWEELDDVVLCGHSYGGMVVAGAVDRLGARVRHAVYLDAFVPTHLDSLVALAGWPDPAGSTMPPPPAHFFGLTGALADRLDRLMTPHPSASATEKLARPVATSTPATYVLATGWASLPHFHDNFARARDDSAWAAVEVDGSHELMLDHPAEVANVLLGVAA